MNNSNKKNEQKKFQFDPRKLTDQKMILIRNKDRYEVVFLFVCLFEIIIVDKIDVKGRAIGKKSPLTNPTYVSRRKSHNNSLWRHITYVSILDS